MKTFKKTFFYGFICALILTVLFLSVFHIVIPSWLQNNFIPRLASDAGISGLNLTIRHVGLFSADFGPISLGDELKPGLSIAGIQVDFSFSGLFHKKIDRIVLNGLTLDVTIKDGKPYVSGIDFDAFQGEPSTSPDLKKQQTHRIPLDLLVIRNSVVRIHSGENTLWVPVELMFFPEPSVPWVYQLKTKAYPLGQEISLSNRIDLSKQQVMVLTEFNSFETESLLPLIKVPEFFSLSGKLSVKARAEMDLSPFRIGRIQSRFEWQNPIVAYPGIRLVGSELSKNTSQGFTIDLIGKDLTEWEFETSGLQLVYPFRMSLNHLKGKANIGNGDVGVSFDIFSEIEAQNLKQDPMIRLSAPVSFFLRGKASIHADGDILFEIHDDRTDKEKVNDRFLVEYQDMTIKGGAPNIQLSGKGNSENAEASLKIGISPIHASIGDRGDIQTQSLSFSGTFNRKPTGRLESHGVVEALNVLVKSLGVKAVFPKVTLESRASGEAENRWRANSSITVSKGSIQDTPKEIFVDGVHSRLNFNWPPENSSRPGSFAIEKIIYKKHDLGRLDLSIKQTGKSVMITGVQENNLFPDLTVRLEGKIGEGKDGVEAVFQAELPKYTTSSSIDLARFAPSMAGVTIGGSFSFKGDGKMENGSLKAAMQVGVSEMRVESLSPELMIEGITLEFFMPDILALKSAPRQVLMFRSLAMGDIQIENGKIEFQLESPKSLFIERGSFRWSEGNIEAHAFRINPDKSDYHVTLYCDRMNLASLLRQLGGVNAEGKGSVNGRVPISFSDGKLSFEDGFFFSTPGVGGKIRLTGADILLAGIPAGTPQFSQLDLAKEALKNYDYNWAKVNLKSEGETLHLRLELDGKPVDVLPFVYRQEFGGFVRVEVDNPGSRFQGINLDVNFRMPLDKVIRYGKNLESIINPQ